MGRHVDAFSGLPPHIHEAVVRAYIGGALATGLDADDLDALAVPWSSEEGRESFYRQFAQADERFTAEIEPMFGDIRCPTLILWGEDDPWIPLGPGRPLQTARPLARFAPTPWPGHLPQLEGPEIVIERVTDILFR